MTTLELFSGGEIVTLIQPFRDITIETPLVVLRQQKHVSVARLGEQNDRYIRVSVSSLKRRDLAWLAGRLAASVVGDDAHDHA